MPVSVKVRTGMSSIMTQVADRQEKAYKQQNKLFPKENKIKKELHPMRPRGVEPRTES
jgi:hypothetical protein